MSRTVSVDVKHHVYFQAIPALCFVQEKLRKTELPSVSLALCLCISWPVLADGVNMQEAKQQAEAAVVNY